MNTAGRKGIWGVAAVVVLMLVGVASAQEEAGAKPPAPPHSIAVLNFETKGKETVSLGENIPDLLSAFLSADENLQLVERAEIKKILEEMALGRTGIVKPEEAARIGYMTGARFIITGRVFIVGDKLYVTAKVISSETSKVGVLLAKGETDGDLEEIVQDLATKTSGFLAEKGVSMLPVVRSRAEILAELKKALEGKPLPTFAVVIPEYHVGRPTVDPAAETEVGYLLKACGAELFNAKELKLSDWAKEFLKETGQEIPSALHKADVVVVGEGFSELAGSTEKLISVKARLELKAVEVKTGRIVAVGRSMTTAVDLAENIAGKTALQEAAANICATLLPQAVEAYGKSPKPAE